MLQHKYFCFLPLAIVLYIFSVAKPKKSSTSGSVIKMTEFLKRSRFKDHSIFGNEDNNRLTLMQGHRKNGTWSEGYNFYKDVNDLTSPGRIEGKQLLIEERGMRLLRQKENFTLGRKLLNLDVNVSTPNARLPVEHDELPVQVEADSMQHRPLYSIPESNFLLVLPYAIVMKLLVIYSYARPWRKLTQKRRKLVDFWV